MPDDTDIVLFELYEAVRMSQKEKIRRLLRKRLCPNDQVVLQYAAVSQYDRSIFQIIKTDLSRRRIELLQLARGNLPTAQQAPYGINSETTIFASHAATVANRLHRGGSTDEDERDYYVPDYDGINCGMSVYSLVGCNQDVAQILYDPGFSNVDEPDAWNNSPLALIELPIVTEDHRPYRINSFIDGLDRYVSVYTWYKDKGALLDRPSGLERATPPHHIARRIGETFSSIPEVRDHALQSEEGNTTSHPDNWDLIRPILAESGFLSDKFRDAHNHDRFSCHCSASINNSVFMTGGTYSSLVEACHTYLAPAIKVRIASVIFRACIYAYYNFSHTCQFAPWRKRRMRADPPIFEYDDTKMVVNRMMLEPRKSGDAPVPVS